MNTLRQSRWMRARALLAIVGALSWLPAESFANPLGEVVIHGDVGFARNGSTLDIMQGTDRAIIEWQSFNIASGESTIFHQPSSMSAALNRVVGGSQSFIDGLLQANGNVWVLNRNGIVLGRNSRVDVNGLLLSTLDVSNDDFLRGGDMLFSGNSTAPVINFGTINAAHGNVFVFAQQVENHGYIGAVDGHVVMLGANEVLLHQGGSNGNVSVKGTVGYGHVYSAGEVEAAEVTMGAVNNNAMAMAVQQKGTVRISGAEKRGGRVLLVANGGAGVSQEGLVNTGGGAVQIQSEGQVQIGGTTDASRADGEGGEIEVIGREIQVTPAGVLRSNGSTGGRVQLDATEGLDLGGAVEALGSSGRGGTASLTGDEVTLREGAVVDAGGAAGGGEIFVGGGFQGANPDLRNSSKTVVETGAALRASATQSGDGGLVTVWSDGETDFRGSILAEGVGNGGVVEVSGREVLGFNGEVSTLGRDGQTGVLLLDPVNVVVSGGATPGSISAASLQTAWLFNNVVVHTFGGAADAGDIDIEENVQIVNTGFNSNSLSFFAHGDINVGSAAPNGILDIRHQSNGNINLVAGWDPGAVNPFAALAPVGGSAQAGQGGGSISAAGLLGGTYGNYGQGAGGVIRLNPDTNKQSAITVGSAGGETNVFGRQLFMNAGDSTNDFVRVGWRHDNSNLVPVTGDINIYLTEVTGTSLVLAGGVGTRQYAAIGHGAYGGLVNTVNGDTLSGDIHIESPGLTVLQAGRGSNAWAIVGHGGRLLRSNELDAISHMEGDITVNAGKLIMAGGTGNAQNFVLIGHGGQQISGVNDTANALTTHSNIVVNAPEGIVMGGGRDDAFVQIGSGGWQVRGTNTGSITVTADKDIELIGANPAAQFVDQSHVMIGFGGFDSDGAHSGDIFVESRLGSVLLTGGSGTENFAMIGHGGRASATDSDSSAEMEPADVSSGRIEVRAAENIILQANDGSASVNAGGSSIARQFVQIGHGGDDSDGTRLGDILVTATNGYIRLDSGGLDDDVNASGEAYTMIGHGGRDSAGDHTGTIAVTAGGDISLKAGAENNRFSLIGHGGRFDSSINSAPTFSNSDGGLMSGDITVTSGGAVSITGGGATATDDFAGVGDVNFAMIGHSLFSARARRTQATPFVSEAWGNITVAAATGIALQGGTRDWTYAAIGHGVHNTDTSSDFSVGDPALGRSANITVTTAAGDITLRGGGYSGFDTTTSENYRYAAIGHHGGNSAFDADGDIFVEAAAGNVVVEGGAQRNTGARIGHGGDEMRQGTNRQHVWMGDIDVRASLGDVQVLGGTGYTPLPGESNRANIAERSYGMIGHGGSRLGQTNLRSFRLDGDIAVAAQNVAVQGGDGSGNFAAIGHGGYQRDGGADTGSLVVAGDVAVRAAYDINIDGGDALSNSVFDGLTLDVDPFVRNQGNFGQIGHFGIPVGNTKSSNLGSPLSTAGTVNVTVEAGRDIGLNRLAYLAGASWGRGAHAMIGVGGNGYVSIDSNGVVPTMDIAANIDVAAGRNIALYGANSGLTYAPLLGAVTTVAPGAGAFAQIGNGGAIINSGLVGISGSLSVRSAGNLLLQTGVLGNPAITSPVPAYDNYAKIGHGDFLYQTGGRASEGFRNGDIEVATGGSLSLYGALIGHIDPRFSNAIGLDGSTFVGVDRIDAVGPEGGSLLATTNAEGLASAIEANVIGQLRLFIPTREQNQVTESTFLNNVTIPYVPYDHPDYGTGDVGVPLLRAGDEAYDKNLVFTFAGDLPQGVFDRTAPYPVAGNYMIYYNEFSLRPPPVVVVGYRPPQVRQDDLPENDLYDTPAIDLGGPNWSSVSRLAGVSSTYPQGWVEEDLAAMALGGTALRPFEIFPWNALMDWQSGGLTFVPGSGLVAVPKAGEVPPEGALVPPVPPAGVAAPAGDKAFEFDFGKPAAATEDDEAKRKKDEAMEGAAPPAAKPEGADMGGAEPKPEAGETKPFTF